MKKFSLLIVIILLAVGGFFSWWVTALSPVDISDKSNILFVVKSGEGIREIANDLKSAGLIRNSVAFFLLVKQQGFDGKIQAGDFRLSKNMNLQTIAENLTHGSLDVWVTFPEGVRANEVAEILKEKIPTYDESWGKALAEHEGYLFPDTYLIPTDATIASIIPIMTKTFEAKYTALSGPRAEKYTKDEIVIIASIVERETRFADDRPLVASVIFNRLEIGMALQIDATVQYVLGYQPVEKTWWKRHLSLADLKIDSPYNTYANAGLPPGPISNPGEDVLNAVLNAPDTNYLYYVSDSTGHNHYSRTFAEHNVNIRKFDL